MDERDPKEFKLSPEVAWYLDERGIPWPTCVPAIKTPEPTGRGVMFDPDRVDRVLKAFAALQHVAGEWASDTPDHKPEPFVPSPWQVAYVIAPVFGWVKRNDAGQWVRVVRDMYVDVPRKNGKSFLASAIAIYMACADGEEGAQVVTAATTREQAGVVFNPIRLLAERSPALRKMVKPSQFRVTHIRTNSVIQVISHVAEAQHGGNIHCAVIDELHIHKKPDLVEALSTGRGSRRQPLLVMITTADAGKPNTIYATKRDYVEKLARREFKDANVYGVVFAARDTDDPFDEATWRKANPGFGITPTREGLAAAAKVAENSPADLSNFLRLHLGVRTRQMTRYLTMGAWDRNASMLDEQSLTGRACFGGLDLASVSDMTALCWLFPDKERGGYDALFRFWVPEDTLQRLNSRTAGGADAWVRQGWLRTTPGNVTDYAFVRTTINADRDAFDVQTIAYDRWNASQLVTELTDDGAHMVPLGQGFASLSAPMKEIQRLVLSGTSERPLLRHGGNPVMRWMIDNLAVAVDPALNVKPDRASAKDKIDGVSALVDAMHEAMSSSRVRVSAYDDGGDLKVI